MSLLSKYYSRQTLIYYALVLPALILEILFFTIIVSNPGQIAPEVAHLGSLVEAVQFVPFAMLALSLFAIIKFRPSMLAVFLTVSFFVFVIVGGIDPLTLIAATSLVVVSMFLSLIGFNYARAAKLLVGRTANVESGGPVLTQVLSMTIELALPFLAALIIVFAVSGAIQMIRSQASGLPPPLSTLTLLYLDSQIGLVFASILIAGVIIWSMRQILEPIILSFTITRSEATAMALGDIDDVVKKARSTSLLKPSSGKVWVVGGIACAIIIFGLSSSLIGWQNTVNDLLNTIKSQPTFRTPVDSTIITRTNDLVSHIDYAFVLFQNLLRTIIRVLWG